MNIFNEEFKTDFYKNHFQKNYLYKPGIIKNYKNIMSMEILNKMLSIKNIWNNKNFIMMLDRKRINFSEFSKPNLDTTGNNLRPDPKNVQKLISKGASIILNDIEIHSPELSDLANIFQLNTNGRCQGNLYFSMESHQAFGPHCDTHDVFAIHFEGEKTWNIYEKIEKNPINHPIFEYSAEERIKRSGKLVNQIKMKPGDLLYIPRGQYHDALASKNGAIHIAFGLTYFKPIDLISVLWEKIILNDYMRGDIKTNSNKNELKEILSKISQQFELIINNDETSNILQSSIKNWPYEIENYTLKDLVSEGKRFYVSKGINLEKINTELFLTNGKDKVKVPDNFCLLTEYIINEEYFTYKSIRGKFPKIPEEIISECVYSLKNMKIVN